jgi:hemerythrin-like domain-containing protein
MRNNLQNAKIKKSKKLDSQSICLNKSKTHQKRKSKSPTSMSSILSYWNHGKKEDSNVYSKNLENYAKSLLQKIKSSSNLSPEAKTKEEKVQKYPRKVKEIDQKKNDPIGKVTLK